MGPDADLHPTGGPMPEPLLDYTRACLDRVELQLRALTPGADPEALAAPLLDLRLRLDSLRGAHAFPDTRFTGVTLEAAERDALWLIAAPWIETRFREAIARANDNILYHHVDARLALRALTDAEDLSARLSLRDALLPGGRLERAGLIHHHARSQEPNPLYAELVPRGDVVAWLLGRRALSQTLARATALSPRREAPERARVALEGLELEPTTARLLERFLQHTLSGERGRILLLHGHEGSGRATHARAVAARLGRGLIELDSTGLPPRHEEAVELLDAAAREAALYREPLLLRHADALLEPRSPWASALRAALSRWPAHVLCCLDPSAQQVDEPLQPFVLYRAHLEWSPDVDRSRRMIAHLEPEHDDALWTPSVLQRCATMTPLQIARTLEVSRMLDDADSPTTSERLLELSVQSQSTADLGQLARASQPRLGFDALILDDDTLGKIRQIVSAVRNRLTVLHSWGLARHIRRGLGIACLFDGEPGTGKTLSAEVIAGTLSLQLLRVNVSNIVDKYIGETEKHLARIFERAQPESSILLFDEADALFSKRTEVKSSNDHYANMSVGVLLQLIEAYTGVCILTTNLKKGIDSAFERRIMYKINFPLPEPPERVRLWQSLVPDDVPRHGEIDFDLLADVEMSGGSIKNAVMRAAYAAAHDDSLLTTEHLLDAAYAEARASGRLVRQYDDATL